MFLFNLGKRIIINLFKQLTYGTVKNLTKLFQIIKSDGRGLICNHAIKVLITKIHLFIEPIFCMVLFI
mgnify:CR=1 FL=1